MKTYIYELTMIMRDLMAGDVRDGIIDFRFWIDAEDEDGKVV